MASKSLRSATLLLLALGLVALIPACGGEDVPTPTTPPPAPPPAPEPPGVPAGFQVSASGEDFIEWSWTAVEGADAYDVQLSLDAEFDGSDPIAAVSGTSFRNPLPLPAETTAHARIRSAAGEGSDRLTSGWSDPVSGMTTASALTKPAIPAGLRVSNQGEDFIEWSWSEVPGAHGYQVEHSRNEQFTDSTTADVAADTRSYRVEDLPSDTEVYLRVRSFVGTGDARLESEWSIHRTGMTEPPAAMAPDTPTINPRVDRGQYYIEWSWNAVSGAEGYEVEFSLDGQFSGSKTADRTAAQRSYRKEGLEPETRGYLQVRAYVMDDGERLHSMWSDAATAVTEASSLVRPVAPQNMRVTKKGPDFIEWSWNPVRGVSGYDVLYSDNAAITDTDPIKELSAEDLSYTKEDLAPDTEHWLQVRAYVSDGTRRLVSPWTPDGGRRGRTELAEPAVPAKLRVDDARTDHDSIGWQWDRVADADDYEFQFGLETPFPDYDSDGNTRGRTWVVRDEIPSQTDAYLRVRSVVGSGTSARRSRWSEPVTGRTEAAPAPTRTPLGRPTGLETGTPRNTTIPLSWDPVTDARRYEVQQNPADGNWTAARCGTGGSFVTNEQCVASSLTEGTNYQFRVRAQPDSGDDTTAAGPWSLTASAKTTGRPPFTVEEGGLNLRWSSEFDRSAGAAVTNTHAIAWTWDPVEDRAAGLIDHYVALLMPSGECPSFDQNVTTTETVTDTADNRGKWLNLDSDIAVTVRGVGDTDGSGDAGALGEVRGLCVVRTWEDNRGVRQFGDVSLVWGTTNPDAPTDENPSTRPPSGASKESIGWAYEVDEGFTYALRLLTVSRNIGQPSSDPADCADGTSVTSPGAVGRLDVPFNYRKINPDPYTYNQLCIRAENDYGQSEWTFVGANELYGTLSTPPTAVEVGAAITKPAAPAVPSYLSAQSASTTSPLGSQSIARLVYSVSENKGTPSLAAQYETEVIRRTAASVPRGQTQTTCDGTGVSGLSLTGFNTNTGVEFEATGTFFPTGGADEHYFHLCVRADPDTTDGNGDEGPWSISSPQRFVAGTVTAPSSPTLADVEILDSNGGATTDSPRKDRLNLSWTLGADEHRSGFEVQYAVSDIQITTVGDNPTTGTVSSPTTMELVITGRSGQYVAARVRSYQAFGQNRVYSTWTSAATRQIPTQ